MRRDGGDALACDARLGDRGERGVGEPAAEREVEARVLARRRADERGREARTRGGVVRARDVRQQLRAHATVGVLVESHDCGSDAVE